MYTLSAVTKMFDYFHGVVSDSTQSIFHFTDTTGSYVCTVRKINNLTNYEAKKNKACQTIPYHTLTRLGNAQDLYKYS